MRQWCANCGNVILLPNGQPDMLAQPGDLCDACMEADRASAEVQQEHVEDERLNRKLRKRP